MAAALYNSNSSSRKVFDAKGLKSAEKRAIEDFLDNGNKATLILWATDSRSSPRLLEVLAQLGDSEIQKAVTGNHSTHPDLLLKLALVHPEQFLSNTVFLFDECFGDPFPKKETEYIDSLAAYRSQIINGEHPAALVDFERISIADQYANTDWSEFLSRDPKEEVRLALAQNLRGEIPHEVEKRLLNDPKPDVRQTLAGNKKLETQLFLKLAGDPDLKVRKALAGNTSRRCEKAHFLLLDQREEEALMELAHNPSIKQPLAIRLTETGFRIRCELATNPSIDHETVEALIRRNERAVKLNLAANTGVIDVTICLINPLCDVELMETIVSNPKCPHLYLSSLAHQKDEQIHLALIRREELPALVQVHLAKEGTPRTRRALMQRVSLGKHQHNSPGMRKVCEILAKDSEEDIRIGILSDSRLTPLFLRECVRKATTEEMRRLACNQTMPVEELMQLCLDVDNSVNHNALCTLLWHAGKAAHGIVSTKDSMATRAYLQIEHFLKKNSGNLSTAQRLLLLGHRDTPFSTLGLFATERCQQTWEALQLRGFRYPFHIFPVPDSQEELMAVPNKKRPSREPMVIHATAKNPYFRGWAFTSMPLPDDLLEALHADPSPYVQYVIKRKLQNEKFDAH